MSDKPQRSAGAMIPTRQEARAAVKDPGSKLYGLPPMVPILWALVLKGDADETVGPLALVGRWVLFQREGGSVFGVRHKTRDEALAFFLLASPEWAGQPGVF